MPHERTTNFQSYFEVLQVPEDADDDTLDRVYANVVASCGGMALVPEEQRTAYGLLRNRMNRDQYRALLALCGGPGYWAEPDRLEGLRRFCDLCRIRMVAHPLEAGTYFFRLPHQEDPVLLPGRVEETARRVEEPAPPEKWHFWREVLLLVLASALALSLVRTWEASPAKVSASDDRVAVAAVKEQEDAALRALALEVQTTGTRITTRAKTLKAAFSERARYSLEAGGTLPDDLRHTVLGHASAQESWEQLLRYFAEEGNSPLASRRAEANGSNLTRPDLEAALAALKAREKALEDAESDAAHLLELLDHDRFHRRLNPHERSRWFHDDSAQDKLVGRP